MSQFFFCQFWDWSPSKSDVSIPPSQFLKTTLFIHHPSFLIPHSCCNLWVQKAIHLRGYLRVNSKTTSKLLPAKIENSANEREAFIDPLLTYSAIPSCLLSPKIGKAIPSNWRLWFGVGTADTLCPCFSQDYSLKWTSVVSVSPCPFHHVCIHFSTAAINFFFVSHTPTNFLVGASNTLSPVSCPSETTQKRFLPHRAQKLAAIMLLL